MEHVLIRRIETSDAAAAAALSGELGYACSSEEMKARLSALTNNPDHVVYLACRDNLAVGWIDVAVVQRMTRDPYGEIAGLVVSSGHRGKGIGQLLVERPKSGSGAGV